MSTPLALIITPSFTHRLDELSPLCAIRRCLEAWRAADMAQPAGQVRDIVSHHAR